MRLTIFAVHVTEADGLELGEVCEWVGSSADELRAECAGVIADLEADGSRVTLVATDRERCHPAACPRHNNPRGSAQWQLGCYCGMEPR
jgi:hypothetical protein